jgi:hypothetical protein
MSMSDYNMEHITHIRIDDHGFNVYMSICYDTLRLHAWKYDDDSIEWETFTDMEQFKTWISSPIKRIKF